MISSNKRRILYITTSDLSKDVGGTVYTKSNIKIFEKNFNVHILSNSNYKRFSSDKLNKLLSVLIFLVNGVPPHINFHSNRFLYKIKLIKDKIDHDYDFIILEHLQLYCFLEHINKPVIFISQNLESELVNTRYTKIPHYLRRNIKKRLLNIEQEFSKKSQGIISISNSESIVYKKYNSNCLTLPPTFDYYIKPKQIHKSKINFGFIGSSHWVPNILAFKELINEILPYIKIDCQLTIVGSGWETIFNNLVYVDNSNVSICFKGYQKELFNFWSSINCLLVPIKTGAGINIKVCESLYNEVNVIGYESSFRGLPDSIKKENYVAENREEFISYINQYDITKNNKKTDYFTLEKNIIKLQNWLQHTKYDDR